MSDVQAFDYIGRDAEGKVHNGTVDAPNRTLAAARLRQMGVVPTHITESKGSWLTRDLEFSGFQRKIGLGEVAVATRQLATMLNAGLTLVRALTIIEEQAEQPKLADVFRDVRIDIERGRTLSDAFQRRGKVFPPLMIHLVKAGEAGGFLAESLESAADAFDAELKIRDTVKASLTYPVIVLIVAILAVIAMLIFIVPVFEKMFADLGGELPLPTQVLVVMSQNMWWFGPLLLVLVLGAWLAWRRYSQVPEVRRAIDLARNRVPVFGVLFRQVAIARFTRTLATTLTAGVPIMQALTIVKQTAGSALVEDAVGRVADGVGRGRSLAALVAAEEVFPPLVSNMVAVGEDTGALASMLRRVAEFTDREVQLTAQRLTAMIEPLMIVIVGVIVGGMIVSLYLPMFGIFEQIQQTA
ncbi:type II secretion system F family protein [Microbacterium album]|uniref:Type II secretion system protein n=1 Tax=Microbacterium album TaxID=2053191 RepID=A0A917IHY7_9MICO|nr:type II secretion system F family protein [Microbacterium album]GGH50406.1 type II secretion system protein [Microbacterium album]